MPKAFTSYKHWYPSYTLMKLLFIVLVLISPLKNMVYNQDTIISRSTIKYHPKYLMDIDLRFGFWVQPCHDGKRFEHQWISNRFKCWYLWQSKFCSMWLWWVWTEGLGFKLTRFFSFNGGSSWFQWASNGHASSPSMVTLVDFNGRWMSWMIGSRTWREGNFKFGEAKIHWFNPMTKKRAY